VSEFSKWFSKTLLKTESCFERDVLRGCKGVLETCWGYYEKEYSHNLPGGKFIEDKSSEIEIKDGMDDDCSHMEADIADWKYCNICGEDLKNG